MDIKDIVAGAEGALPTLERNLSTGTAAVPQLPTITADPLTLGKLAGGTMVGLAGMLLLGYGRKNNDVQKMLIGAALTFASVLLF